MIQRIQSVWLLLVSACAFASLKLPFYSGFEDKAAPFQIVAGSTNFGLLIVTVIIGVLALFTIFDFRNRIQQLRLCILGILLEALLIYLYYHHIAAFTIGTYALPCVLQLGVLIFFILAARAINKDEKLVKESDRLR
jgi:hypothetical protein